MTTNANITIYHRYVDPDTRLDGFRRYPVYNVLWEENKAANIIASGLESADAVTIYVQIDHMDGVEIDNGIKAVVFVLQQLKIAQRANIIAQGQVAGGLYSGKNAFFGVHERFPPLNRKHIFEYHITRSNFRQGWLEKIAAIC